MTGHHPSTADRPRSIARSWIVGAMLAATLLAVVACGGPEKLDLSLSLRTEHNFFRVDVASGTTSASPKVAGSGLHVR